MEHFVAEVKFNFDAGSDRELNLKPGQTIRLAPAKFQPNNVRGWALASDGSRIGLVPLNYIKVLGKRSPIIRTMNEGMKSNDSDSILNAVPEAPPSRPRVRFDLNPRPPESDSSRSCANSTQDNPPAGILIRNENSNSQSLPSSTLKE